MTYEPETPPSYAYGALLYSGDPGSRASHAAARSLEPFTLNIRSLSATLARQVSSVPKRGLLLALLTLSAVAAISGCAQRIYVIPQYNFAGRPTPPSRLQSRVLVSVTSGSSGGLQILDGLRDLRNNVQNTIPSFSIGGYSGNNPTTILNYPGELRGYVYSAVAPYTLTPIDYSKEAAAGGASSLNSPANSIAISPDFKRVITAQVQTGQVLISDATLGTTFALNVPNAYQVAVNAGDTVALAMVKNSNTLYRIVKLNLNQLAPPGSADCEPTILPVYCAVPVPGKFDRPIGALFSADGSTVYVLNCGVECGGGQNGGAGVSFISQGNLQINNIPTAVPYPAVVTNTISIPGGVTAAITDGANLYFAGQSLMPDGLFTGNLTTLNLITLVPGAPVSIADGNHSKLLFADDNTLWVAAQQCSTGERAKLGQNYNCLTRYDVAAQTAAIIPAILPVAYPNTNQNPSYYGSLTGLCWVEGFHKVYTAYGGQVHAFKTLDGSEIDNTLITVPGTALDVAYIDATNDTAD